MLCYLFTIVNLAGGHSMNTKFTSFSIACLLIGNVGGTLNGASIDIPSNLFSHYCTGISKSAGDYPLPTALSFGDFCDHKISCTMGSFDPDAVELGDAVFVMNGALSWFVENVHPLIRNQYILVSCDSACSHPGPEVRTILYDPKVAAWFSNNLILSNHPKCTAIPYSEGSDQSHFDDEHRQYYLKLSARTTPFNKAAFPLVYANQAASDGISNQLLNNPICFNDKFLDINSYWDQLSKFKFTLVARGEAGDTRIIWEAIGLKSIPIMKHSPFDALYEGTPSVIVKNWEDVTEEFLKAKLEEVSTKIEQGSLSNEKAFFGYWADQINTVKYALKFKQEAVGLSDLQRTKFDINSLNTIKGIVLDSSINRNSCLLLVYGKCLSLRAFQLANCMPEFQKIMIADEFAFDSATQLNICKSFANDDALFENNHPYGRSDEFTYESTFPSVISNFSSVRMFMDLTYYRFKFTDQLLQFYQLVPAGTIICGNMAADQYVQEILQDFSSQNAISIHYQNDFWFLSKN